MRSITLALLLVVPGVTQAQPVGKTITLKVGADLQAAVNSASGGDRLLLPDGFSWTGNLKLPARADNGMVTISAVNVIPTANQRMRPGEAKANLISPNADPVIANDFTNADHSKRPAHGYTFIGLELKAIPVKATLNWNLVVLISGPNPKLSDYPHDIVIDRCYIHGENPANYQVIRGGMLNVNNLKVLNSYFSGFKSTFMEANAFMIYTGGPFLIQNNYLEGACENVMIGASMPEIPGQNPHDGVFRGNFFNKPPEAFKNKTPAYFVKNLLEFKNAERMLVDGNLLENSWEASQAGFAILITPRTGGQQATVATRNLTFTNNIIRHIAQGVTLSNFDDMHGSLPVASLQESVNVVFRNNLFDDISGVKYSGSGHSTGIQISGPPHGLVLDSNTWNWAETFTEIGWSKGYNGWYMTGESSVTPSDMKVTNNLFGWNIGGDSRDSHDAVPPGATFTHNAIVNVQPQRLDNWKEAKSGTAINPKEIKAGYGADVATLLKNEPAIRSGNR